MKEAMKTLGIIHGFFFKMCNQLMCNCTLPLYFILVMVPMV